MATEPKTSVADQVERERSLLSQVGDFFGDLIDAGKQFGQAALNKQITKLQNDENRVNKSKDEVRRGQDDRQLVAGFTNNQLILGGGLLVIAILALTARKK